MIQSPFLLYACEEAGITPPLINSFYDIKLDEKMHIKKYVMRNAYMPRSMERSIETATSKLKTKNKDDTIIHTKTAGILIAKKKRVQFTI